MQEFWFCEACKSMNRADADRCYRCRAPKTQATMATVRHRQAGVVLTPGLDEEHREVAWALMSGRRYISAWKLGYVAASLMTVALAEWTFSTVVFAIYVPLRLLDPNGQAASALDQQMAAFAGVLTLIGLVMPVSIALDCGFLGLTSMNAPALGCGSPRFGPIRSYLWWIETLLWLVYGLLLLGLPIYVIALVVIPVELIAAGGLLAGGLLVILWIYFMRWVYGELGGPFAAIGKPRRLLQDLMERLGVPGASDSRLVGYWSMAWGTFVGVFYAASLGPLLLGVAFFLFYLVAGLAGLQLTPAPESQVTLYLTLLVVFIGAVLLISFGACLYTKVRITFELSRRQRVREEWVLSGVRPFRAGAAIPGPLTPGPAAHGPGWAVPESAGPQQTHAPEPSYPPSGVAPPQGYEPLPQFAPRSVPQPPDDPVVWSRPVERLVAGPSFEPLPVEELPSAWSRAIEQAPPPTPSSPAPGRQSDSQQGPPPAEPAAHEIEAEDRPVIQPSRHDLSRYRAPQVDVESDHPVDGSPNDLDIGEGI